MEIQEEMVYIPVLETLGVLLQNESIAAEVCIYNYLCLRVYMFYTDV